MDEEIHEGLLETTAGRQRISKAKGHSSDQPVDLFMASPSPRASPGDPQTSAKAPAPLFSGLRAPKAAPMP